MRHGSPPFATAFQSPEAATSKSGKGAIDSPSVRTTRPPSEPQRPRLSALLAGACAAILVAALAGAHPRPPATGTSLGVASQLVLDRTRARPDLGPNVLVFDPSMPRETIQSAVEEVFKEQERAQFGGGRHAFLFAPGRYRVDVAVGYFTQVLGLGLLPGDTVIEGAVHVEADWFGGNATHNFWRGAENLTVDPTGGTDRWAVSQAAPYRRMHLRGDLVLDDGGWSSGGFFADVRVDGQVDSGSQQQWYSRNTYFGSWRGSNWNMVFQGVVHAPAGSFPHPPYTTLATTPVVREKPFLYVDRSGRYRVFVPALRVRSSGTSWGGGCAAGTSLPIERFHIVKAGATAGSMNAALARGLNLLVTPGIYHLDDTVRVTRAGTVVLGLGLATLQADDGVMALSVADVPGVKIAGILIEAGTTSSPTLMEVGPAGSSRDHANNPTSLHDLFFRIGGAHAGKATVSLRINSHDVIGDHLWLWRGDHGSGIGWTANTADTGLVVNGDDVTMYGLFVEHYQKHQTIWNGQRGRTFFYQNELPYDPPDQASWMDGTSRGYAAYKVGNGVTAHEAWGLGSYCYFRSNPNVVLDRAFEAPTLATVRFRSLTTVSLGGGVGTIAHIINDAGDPVSSAQTVATLASHP